MIPRLRSLAAALRPRFSLRSLIAFQMLVVCCFALRYRWEPWAKVREIPSGCDDVWRTEFSADGRWLACEARVNDPYTMTCVLMDARGGTRTAIVEGEEWELSPRGDRAVVATNQNSYCRWRLCDTRTGDAILDRWAEWLPWDGHIFSPDGGTLVVPSSEYVLRIWDAGSGECLHALGGHELPASCEFSPDGARIVTAGDDGLIQLVEARAGRVLGRARMEEGRVVSAEWSAGGARILAFGKREVRCLDGRSLECIYSVRPNDGDTDSCYLLPGGERFVTAGDDREVCLWDALTGERLCVLAGDGFMPVRFISLADDSVIGFRCVRLGALGDVALVRVWDGRTGELKSEVKVGRDEHVHGVLKGGTRLVSTRSDTGLIRITDLMTGAILQDIGARPAKVRWVEISPHGRTIAASCSDGTVRIWDADTLECLRTIRAHGEGKFRVLGYSPDGSRLTTTARDIVRVWDTASGDLIAELAEGDWWIGHPSFSLDGAMAVTCDERACIELFDAGTAERRFRLEAYDSSPHQTEYSPDGKRILTVCRDGDVHLWCARTGARLARLVGHTDCVSDADFSADGRLLVTVSYDDTGRIWNVDTGECTAVLTGHGCDVWRARWVLRDTMIITEDERHVMILWDVATGELICRMKGHGGHIDRAGFSPSGARIVSHDSSSHETRIWDPASGECVQVIAHPARQYFEGPDPDCGLVLALEQSPSSAFMTTAAGLWDAETGRLRCILADASRIESAGWSSDGRRLATAGGGVVRIWDVTTGERLATLRDTGACYSAPVFSPDGRSVSVANWVSGATPGLSEEDTVVLWRRRRPEAWWGFVALPELWLAALFAGALVWSLAGDRRSFGRRTEP